MKYSIKVIATVITGMLLVLGSGGGGGGGSNSTEQTNTSSKSFSVTLNAVDLKSPSGEQIQVGVLPLKGETVTKD